MQRAVEGSRPTRRRFLASAVAASAALSLQGCASARARRILGANESLRLGVVGLNGRGSELVGSFRKVPGVRIAALCDVDRAVLDRATVAAAGRGDQVAAFTDYRRLLDSGEVDAVVIATPNHWHTLMGVMACEAGLDAYVEKPVSHDVWEGAQLVAAAEQHGRVVACGTQCRSHAGPAEAIAFARSGQLGAMKLVRGLCYKRRASIGKVRSARPVPATVDADLWFGPAPIAPVMRSRFHYDWHWQWPYGNGDLGNQGVHQMDLCRWAIGAEELPRTVLGIGGRVGYDDDGETPNTQLVWADYAPVPIVFEVRGLPERAGSEGLDAYLGAQIGLTIHCEHGTVVINSYTAGFALDKEGKRIREFKGGGDHFANFVTAARAGDAKLLNADARTGHLSAALCHLGNDSVRRGRPAGLAEIAERVAGTPALAESLERMRAHLQANGIGAIGLDRDDTIVLGAVADPGEDKSLWQPRAYRAPFVLEEQA